MRQSCAWPAFEVTRSTCPLPIRKRMEKRLSWDLVPYDTVQRGGSGTPGASTPRHLPPSGFDHPPDGLLPSVPGTGPSASAASMGFALQGLAPPDQRCPSRDLASPVVSPPGPQGTERPRLQRFTLTGKGLLGPMRRNAWNVEPCPPGFRPSRAFSSAACTRN